MLAMVCSYPRFEFFEFRGFVQMYLHLLLVVEFDSPNKLLDDNNSVFHSLVYAAHE